MTSTEHRHDRAQPVDATTLAVSLAAGLHRPTPAATSEQRVHAEEMQSLLDIARALEESAATLTPSAEFRASARTRLLAAIAAEQPLGRALPRPAPRPTPRPRPASSYLHSLRLWLARFAATAGAVSLAGAATAHAATDALPGEPLYTVKEIGEQIALQLADGERARAEVLLHQANARLDETTRLLQSRRVNDAAGAAARYEQTMQRARAILEGQHSTEPSGDVPASFSAVDDALLAGEQARAMDLFEHAPQTVRAELEPVQAEPETPPSAAAVAPKPTERAASPLGVVRPVPPTAPATRSVEPLPAPAARPAEPAPVPALPALVQTPAPQPAAAPTPPASAPTQAPVELPTASAPNPPARKPEFTPPPENAVTRPQAAAATAQPPGRDEPHATPPAAAARPPEQTAQASRTAPPAAAPQTTSIAPPANAQPTPRADPTPPQAARPTPSGQAAQPTARPQPMPELKPTAPKPQAGEPPAGQSASASDRANTDNVRSPGRP